MGKLQPEKTQILKKPKEDPNMDWEKLMKKDTDSKDPSKIVSGTGKRPDGEDAENGLKLKKKQRDPSESKEEALQLKPFDIPCLDSKADSDSPFDTKPMPGSKPQLKTPAKQQKQPEF